MAIVIYDNVIDRFDEASRSESDLRKGGARALWKRT